MSSRCPGSSSVVLYPVLFAILVGSGCGPKDSDDARSVSAGDVSNLDQFVTSYVEALCTSALTCGIDYLRFTSIAQCKEQMLISADSSGELRTPGLHYDADQGARCISALNALTCDGDVEASRALMTACTDFIYGEAEADGACNSDAECKQGLECLETTCPGRCIVPPTQGQPCPDRICAQGLNCITVTDATTGMREAHCEADGAEGAACGPAIRDCEFALACDDGACRPAEELYPPAALGEPCSINGQCVAGQYCGPGSDGANVCTQRVTIGGACEPANVQMCARGHYCATAGELGTCTPASDLGGSCADRSHCLAGQCIAGTCQFERANGEACSANEECYSSTCNAGVCVLAPACPPEPASAAATP